MAVAPKNSSMLLLLLVCGTILQALSSQAFVEPLHSCRVPQSITIQNVHKPTLPLQGRMMKPWWNPSSPLFAVNLPIVDAEVEMIMMEEKSVVQVADNQNDIPSNDNKTPKIHNTNPTPVLVSAWKKLTSSSFSVPVMVATLLLVMTVSLSAIPDVASAAMSGGRMGGSFGSSAPPMRSAPPRMGGGGYGGGSRYYGGGARGGITVAPIITPPIVPIVPGPYIGPYGGGPGVMAAPLVRGPSFFDLIFFGTFGFVLLSALTSTFSGIASSTATTTGFWDSKADEGVVSTLGPGVTVAELSVALEIPNRDDRNSILTVLDRLAQTAKTDSRVGVQDLTHQVALELLRRKSSIVSAHTESKHFRGANSEKAQREFNLRAIQERGKFEEETVSRYGGVDYASQRPMSSSSSSSPGAYNDKATMAVVTLVIAIDGDSTKFPTIQSIGDVEDALRRLATDVKVDQCLQSAEILWTPQDRSETLTRRDVIADYPKHRSV